MATTNEIRDWWHLYRCSYGTSTNMFGRTPVYAQNTEWVRALEQAHFNAGYFPTEGGYIGSKRNCPSGIGGKTCQENGKDCSLHNYGLAWDVEYNFNPHIKQATSEAQLWDLFNEGVTKYNPDIVDVILGVKNTQGEQLFSWLGYSLGDFMHWQINVPPERSEIDWSTVGDSEMDMQWSDIVDDATWTKAYEDGFIEGDPNVMPQYYFADGPATEDEKKNAYNHIMREQMDRT